ncbi:group 1 glycosyl transferase, partial [Brunnivagina elsteri CCALA 953]
MSKILFISAHTPTYKYPQAGQKIAFNHLQEYANSNHKIDILVIANQTEIDTASDLIDLLNNNIYFYPLTKIKKISSCLKHYNIPLKFATRSQSKVSVQITELISTNTYDIIHFEYSHAAVYLELIQALINPELTKTVISIHDIITQSLLRKTVNNSILGIEAARTFNYETKIYLTANHLWVLSQKDKDILTSLFSVSPNKISVKPPKL